MRTTLPDEQGWYWAKGPKGDWHMAFVSTSCDMISFLDPEFYDPDETDEYNIDNFDAEGWTWHGPFTCPGGDFGGHTVVVDEDLHEQAKAAGKAIVLQYVDFHHCKEEPPLGSITITSLRSRDEAESIIHRTD